MKTKRFTYNKRYLYILLSMLLPFLSSCIDDKHTIVSGDKELVKLSIDSPYSRGDVGENPQSSLENVVVLVFKVEEGKKDVFAYRALASEPKYKEGTTYEIGAYLTHSKEQEKYRLVLLGNPDKKYGNLHHLKGKDKETVLKELLFDAKVSETGYDWADKKALPLHGESDARIIHEHTSFNDIAMTRALAKVDITLNEVESVFTEYTLEEAWSYNSVNKGYIAQIGNQGDLELPNLTEENYNEFIPFSNGIMLLAENKAGVADDIETTTCFVIGVSKKDADDSSKETRYYRVDLKEGENFLPILRNNHYSIIVDAITGDGADNKEDALKQEIEIDCTVQIGEWNLLENEYEFEDTSDNLENNHCLDFQNGSGKKIFVEDGKTEFTVEFSLFKDDWKRLFITEKNNGLFKISSITKAEAKADGSTKKAKEKITLKVKILDNAKFQEDGPHLPFTIGLTKHENDNNNSLSGTTLTIENKPTDESPSFMQTDVEVYGPTFESIPIPPNSENFKAKIFGKYVKGKDSEKNHYIEVTIKEDAIPNDFFTYAKIYTNEVNGYKFQPKENIDKSLLNGIYTIKVPCSGTFIKAGVDHFTLNFKYDSPMLKVNYYMPITNEVFAEDLEEPIAENLRILVVAADYVFHDNKQEFFPYRNLGRILRGEKNFSLLKFPKEEENETAVRVAPFEFRYCTMRYKWNFDETPRNIVYWADNLQEVETLFNLDQDEYIKKWMDFDIILYVRSNNPTDLNEGYVSYMQEFLNKPGKVLIQTPSKRRRGLSLGNGEYEEKLLKDSEAKRGMKVYGSSYIFKNQRLVKGVNSVDTETDLYKSTTILGFPEKDKEEDVISQDVRYRDFNYTTLDYDAKGYKVLGRLDIVKEIDIIDGDYPVMLSSTTKNRNHIWIGSSYFFADVAFGATKSGVPVDKYLTEYKGLIKGERELVANSKYFMNLMNWAIHKTKEGTETTK